MADYQLTETDGVIRTADQAWIPNDPDNRDRVEYDKWLADGGVPDPAVDIVPPMAPGATTDDVLFDHENRLRTIEGEPLLTREEFASKVSP